MTHRLKMIIGFTVLCSAMLVAFVQIGTSGAPIKNGQKHMVIIIPSYNNKEWYKLNVGMIFAQKYDNYRVIYIDDCSSDGTADLVEQYVAQCGQQHRVTLIRNKERQGALYNLYHAIHSCDDHAIILTYDGDDWFKDDQVLATVNKAYDDPNVWLTYGQFEVYPGNTIGQCRPMPDYIITSHSYRQQPWITSHLRTFYAGLFKGIKEEDLLFEGKFFEVTWDQAFLFPMLEMANGHFKFIDRVLYVYNQQNPLNDFKVRLGKQLYCERVIRRKTCYQPLDEHEARRSFVVV
jgi:glycosyltransferase involved in cell wall biosynthesis